MPPIRGSSRISGGSATPLKRDQKRTKRTEHAPVNPVTGLPNVAGAPAQDVVSHRMTPAGAASTVPPDVSEPVAQTGEQLPDFDRDVEQAHESTFASAYDFLLSVLENRVLSLIVLGVLDVVVVGIENLILFALAFVVGYILIDRFANARRVVVLGGVPWLSILLIGFFVSRETGPVMFGLDYLFMFCGFLAAVSVCGVFFVGHAFYDFGYERGGVDADRTIAAHMRERLIEHPDDWGTVDGDFPEVESAMMRVRERQRAAEQALRDESGRKDDLVTYLAHDLKTPLASVVGYLSLLHEAPDLPEEQRVRFTGVALDKAHRLDVLIEEFFDITRFDFHDIVLTRGYVDLNLMLAQVVDEFYPTLTEQNKHAEIDVPQGLVVLVDGDKMARVFNNVMKNAIAYSYEGSTIRIEAEAQDGSVIIRFENRGDPIPAPKLKVIFEKFYRLDAARATNRGGAGLGLAIAKEIVVAHGGSISCTSTPEHTVFTITLPE